MRLKKFVKLLPILLFFGLLGAAYTLREDFFRIKKISCLLNGQPCPSPFTESLDESFIERSAFSVNDALVQEWLGSRFPQIELISVKKNIPDKMTFEFGLRRVMAAVNGDKFQLIDQSGTVVEWTETPGQRPIIFLEPPINLQVGQKFAQKEILKTIELISQLSLRLIEPKTAELKSADWVLISLKNDTQVMLSLQKETTSQLDSLQLILQRSKIEGKSLKKIDLRFEKPVVEEN